MSNYTKKRKGKAPKSSSNGRHNNVRRDPEMVERGTEPVKDRTNDPAWYAANPQLLQAAGKYSFANVLGADRLFSDASVPGILSYYWCPVLGTNDPAVIATRNVYSFVRHANSGSPAYDAPDLMMYILAVDSAYSYIASLMRVYGVMKLYNQKNMYMPKAILTAMGIDFDSINGNLANMNYFINSLIARASVLWVPDTMPFVERHFWMNSNLFTDGASSKAQLYVPVQQFYWKYNPTKSEQGGGLEPLNFYDTSHLKSYTDLVNYAETLFSQLDANNEDFGIMGGDILKAYGREKIYTINEIPFDYTVMPIYSTEVLSQIHNSTAVNVVPTGISQDASGKIYVDYPKSTTAPTVDRALPSSTMLDFFQGEDPTPEQVMVATRLTTCYVFWAGVESGGTTTYSPNVVSVGTEIVIRYRMWYFTNGQDEVQSVTFNSQMEASQITPSFMAKLSKFDWAPFIYVVTDGKVSDFIGDVEMYTTIDYDNVKKLHTVATWSEFGIPAM